MFIEPTWPAPTHIKAYTTTRLGGVSVAPFDQFNLAEHVGDQPNHIQKNREILSQKLQLPNEPIWLTQTHSSIVVEAKSNNKNKVGDASYTNEANQVCAILTADCLPILLCHSAGTHVAAIHAGWKGLANGVIESTLDSLNLNPADLLAWLGPGIGPNHFEIGNEVREQFLRYDPAATQAFKPSPNKDRWLANLYALARRRLTQKGILAIYGGELCTYSDPTRFYSYRRDGVKTGRMATLIWINNQHTVK